MHPLSVMVGDLDSNVGSYSPLSAFHGLMSLSVWRTAGLAVLYASIDEVRFLMWQELRAGT